MTKRELIDTATDKRYVRRNGRSLSADRRQTAKTKAKSGEGSRRWERQALTIALTASEHR
ncbi:MULTISPECIES: hypothetical protein [unclassified Rhizobium]|uniref:hypothetical protein n=1 Tax=unclassified Rhizobium TaxID=2613769 RepID=UPI001A983377|nr:MULTISPECIES: hypothetical protein [unclassified Rhizobium]MBX5156070.1 hypothetical protein [Rhizobium sp. NZLR8]MBX5164401.1 hypothetical protein [Rhizobium sp. NZLR4b]MBX5184204.1 hypothetical protein [Rhizobium sp. NZLR5]MBX5192403.1 hypothetical protein [Rhizobium sp. NZLR3b]MBX5201952.1 hypothetical protein [Rhizobium sp. NZLR1]